MNYYIIEPEVAGEIGENTIYEYGESRQEKENGPIIKHLHFVFDGWLGDDIIETSPCFLVSERLKLLIEKNMLSGCVFQNVEISYSDLFKELYPDRCMPIFYRLVPTCSICINEGKYNSNINMKDFMISQKNYLVISEKAKSLFSSDKCVTDYADYSLLSMK